MSCQCPLTQLLNRGCQCGAFLAEKNKLPAAQLSCFIWNKRLVTTSAWVTGFPVSHPWSLALPDGLYQILLSGIVEGSGRFSIANETSPGNYFFQNITQILSSNLQSFSLISNIFVGAWSATSSSGCAPGVVPSQLPIKILWATDPGHHLACNEANLQILKLS